MIFDSAPLDCAVAGECAPLGRHLQSAATAWPWRPAEAVKRKSAGPARRSRCIQLRTQAGPSLNHFVAAHEERLPDREPERLRGLEVDD